MLYQKLRNRPRSFGLVVPDDEAACVSQDALYFADNRFVCVKVNRCSPLPSVSHSLLSSVDADVFYFFFCVPSFVLGFTTFS